MKKYIVCLLAAMISLAGSSQTVAANAINPDGAVVMQDESEWLYDPGENKYLPVRHVEDEVKAISEENGHDYEFEHKFEESRKVEAGLMHGKQKNSLLSEANIPGGVGYGTYFTSSFKDDFTTGTNIYYNIICPSTAGGNVNNLLYLTSSNRAAKGVEAFIYYDKQNNPTFRVFDWSRPEAEHWQTNLSYNELKQKYLWTINIKGTNRQCVTVQNQTYQTSSNKWINVVWLKNSNTGEYDRIYSHTYTATLADQRDSYFGSWGPIVETFQNSYSNTNVMGFYNINLQSKTTSYSSSTWNGFELLTSNVSTIRSDNLGFKLLFLDPNYTFAVN